MVPTKRGPELSARPEPPLVFDELNVDDNSGDARPVAEVKPSRRKMPRAKSLDALRGLLLIATVAANSLVHTPSSIDHHPWAGVNALDLIFPVFVTMTGCGIAFAYRNGISSWPRLLRRVLVLYAAGLLYNALTTNQWDVATWRITGVLQLYAVIIGLVSLGHVWFRTWRSWLWITVGSSSAYTAMTTLVATTCPGGQFTRECNPSLIDTTAPWHQHVYHQGALGHDPEGIIATFGALISVTAGAAIGHAILRGHRNTKQSFGRNVALIGGLAATFAVIAVLCVTAPTIFGLAPTPIMKRLWTAPFALSVAACVALALLALQALIDDPHTRLQRMAASASYPLLALGRNSLLVYFGSHVINSWFKMFPDPENSIQDRLAGLFGGGLRAELAVPLMMILVWTLVAIVLHRRRIYLRA